MSMGTRESMHQVPEASVTALAEIYSVSSPLSGPDSSFLIPGNDKLLPTHSVHITAILFSDANSKHL